jgi:hypothetical protein
MEAHCRCADGAGTGTALILLRGAEGGLGGGSLIGYGAAILCALTWSGYSLMSRQFGETPTDVITGFCLLSAVLSAVVPFGLLETTVWPVEMQVSGSRFWDWASGRSGLAFYAWDYGVKNGDIQVLGVSSYTAPLLSTLILIVFGYGEASIAIAVASLLITGGAFLAAYGHAAREEKPVSGLISEPDAFRSSTLGLPVACRLRGLSVPCFNAPTSWMRTGAKTLAVGALAVLAYQTGGPCVAGWRACPVRPGRRLPGA